MDIISNSSNASLDNSICPINSNDCNWEYLYHSSYNNYNLPIHICRKCGFQAQYPFQSDFNLLYNEDYYSGNAEYSYIDERKQFKFHSYTWDNRLEIIQSQWIENFPTLKFKNLRFLEVGSSFGGFLSRVKSKGHIVQGLEVSSFSANYANLTNIPTFNGTLEESRFTNHSFDIIVLNEVLEHLPNPRTSFDILINLMSVNSILIIQTANFEGWQAIQANKNYHYYLPGHLFYYTESIIKEALHIRGIRKFQIFYGSDVSLYSKMMKIRGSFKNLYDYRRWFQTAFFHLKSKFKKEKRPLTSGFVIYAFRSIE